MVSRPALGSLRWGDRGLAGSAHDGRDDREESGGAGVGEDRAFQLAQGWAGIEPGLLGQDVPGLPEGLQRRGLAAVAVEGDHELPPEPFPQRVVRDQALELAREPGDVAAAQVGGDARLQSLQSQLGVEGASRVERAVVGQVGTELTPPRRQCVPVAGRGGGKVAGLLSGAGAAQSVLGRPQVHVHAGEPVARRGVSQGVAVRAERLSHGVDVDLYRCAGGGPPGVGVDGVGEPVIRHRRVARGGQHREDRARAHPGQRHRGTVDDQFHRPEQAHLHRHVAHCPRAGRRVEAEASLKRPTVYCGS
jgi:hypothetical protein